MADIFLSYAREDEARIQPLISAFTKEGWSVFWDRHIPAGQTWRSHIGQALGDAKCVIVAWTRFSVVSSWVSEEADVGRQRGVLVPILLDTVEVPIGFRSIQVANLTEWAPGQNSPRFEQLLDDINALMAASPIANTASYQSEPGQDKQELPDRSVPRAKKSRQRSIVYAFITVIFAGACIGIRLAAVRLSDDPRFDAQEETVSEEVSFATSFATSAAASALTSDTTM